jgi:ubiquinone/menaquinone biosynthesis C-methylase UbiE
MAGLLEEGLQAIGLDASPQMGRIAQRRLQRSHKRSPLVNGWAQALPFPNQSFDSIVASFPTAYIVDPITLREINRILRPNGRLVIVVGARLTLTGRDPIARFVEWLYRITGQREHADLDKWITLFNQAGFSICWKQIEMIRSQVYLILAEHAQNDQSCKTDRTAKRQS